MKELDLILQAWLERRYASASSDERAAFAGLLELPDPEIAGYLLGAARPSDPAVAAVVAQLGGGVARRAR
jgi:antitoxin CptB